MSMPSAPWRARVLLACAMMLMATSAIACEKDDTGTAIGEEEIARFDFSSCLTAIGNGVSSVVVSSEANRLFFVSSQRPPSLPSEASWRSSDRALYLRDVNQAGVRSFRYLSRSWDHQPADGDVMPAFSTPRPGQTSVVGYNPTLVPREVQVSADGNNFVLAVTRAGARSEHIVRLYAGVVPETDQTVLDGNPGGGLTMIPLNRDDGSEKISIWTISPDGQRVAASVGTRGELRVYDLGAAEDNERLRVYTLGEANEIVVHHELPAAQTSIDVSRRAAVLVGTADLTWAPQGDRLAIARDASVGVTQLSVLNTAEGQMTGIRQFRDETIPKVAWSADGESFVVMSTQVGGATVFGDTTVRRIAAAEGGSQIGSGLRFERFPDRVGWRSEPSNLLAMGSDEHFLFTWEGLIYRMDAPGGDISQGNVATFPITSLPANVSVLNTPLPSYNVHSDSVVFRVLDGNSVRVAERTAAMENVCPKASGDTAAGAG